MIKCFFMSGEHIINSESNSTTDEVQNKYSSKKRVDINILLNKVRTEKKKERYENIIFVCLVTTVIVVTGVIVSL